MDKKTFNRITKEIFSQYGFSKQKNLYVLFLEDITIKVQFCSWRGVKYFCYGFFINKLYDSDIELIKTFDNIFEIKMEHDLCAKGYHRHEILFEEYEENDYAELLMKMLHFYFDVYKENSLLFLKNNANDVYLSQKAKGYSGIT